MKAALTVFFLLIAQCGWAGLSLTRDTVGDHFVYAPDAAPRGILVIAHGTRAKSEKAQATARRFAERWTDFADRNGLILIAPVFDDARFGNRGGGYGGYRGLFGRYVPADKFVLGIVARYRTLHSLPKAPLYLYGHSAGAQFAVRFGVRHPHAVTYVIASAAGRYSFPTPDAPWPYGAGMLQRKTKWPGDGAITEIEGAGRLQDYAAFAPKVAVLIGARDVAPQPTRPAHETTTRVATAKAWVQEMNRIAPQNGQVKLLVAPGIAHDSNALTPLAMRLLRPHLPR